MGSVVYNRAFLYSVILIGGSRDRAIEGAWGFRLQQPHTQTFSRTRRRSLGSFFQRALNINSNNTDRWAVDNGFE
jgi:hypothetical protein